MAFHEVQFSTEISYGSSGGPKRLTQVVTTKSGAEQRNQVWADSKRSYDAGIGIRKLEDISDIIAFWEARSGALNGFRYKDWADYNSSKPGLAVTNTDQTIDVGDGVKTQFQLIKTYSSGGYNYARAIRKPVVGTVVVAKDGVAALSGWTLDSTTGIITFSVAPANGVVITAGYEFDVPVRFEEDQINVSIEGFMAGAMQSIRLVEIRV